MKIIVEALTLIKELISNGISFKIYPIDDNRIEFSAGYNQVGLEKILEENKIKFEYIYGHYYWKAGK